MMGRSTDHRTVDGVLRAELLGAVKCRVENVAGTLV